MNDAYTDREQTAAKHFILEHYLQGLAFKTLQGGYPVLTYIDGFSGPWKSREPDYSDTSFMIAIRVLKEVQQALRDKGENRAIKCFFVEKNAKAFAELHSAVMPHHDPTSGFYVETFNGRFEDAVPRVMKSIRGFALTFIDPTGWTEYPFDTVDPILKYSPGEVLVNFMLSFAARFTQWNEPAIRASFNGILRPGWPDRIDKTLPLAEAVEKLFRSEFKEAGNFKWVVATPIKKLGERIHFCITYGTRHPKGLEFYRSVEHHALREHDFRRFASGFAKGQTGQQSSLFTAVDLYQKGTSDAQMAAEREAAARWVQRKLVDLERPVLFASLWPEMLELFALTKSQAKDTICELADQNKIERTWRPLGSKRRKPDDADWITLDATSKSYDELSQDFRT